jgi:hypothetical protein
MSGENTILTPSQQRLVDGERTSSDGEEESELIERKHREHRELIEYIHCVLETEYGIRMSGENTVLTPFLRRLRLVEAERTYSEAERTYSEGEEESEL